MSSSQLSSPNPKARRSSLTVNSLNKSCLTPNCKSNKKSPHKGTMSPLTKAPQVNPTHFGYTIPNNYTQSFNSQSSLSFQSDDPEMIRGSKEFVAHRRRQPYNMEKRILELINEFRNGNGLEPLQFSRFISDIISAHTQKMAKGQIPISNVGQKERVNQIDGLLSFAEHIGTCLDSPKNATPSSPNIEDNDPAQKLMNSWIPIKKYKDDMLGRFNKIGISIDKGKDSWVATVFFALVY